MPDFSHLHVHTQFSLLDGAADITRLFKKAEADGMKAMAITDHGNMMGAFHFVKEVTLHNKNVKAKNEEAIAKGEAPTIKEIKPILGCEFFVCDNHLDKTRKDNGYQIVLLAKSKKGYQ